MSGSRNPFYDPGWAAKVAALEAERAQWEALCGETARAEGFGGRRHLAAMARFFEVKEAAARAAMGQYEFVADYAAWRFSRLPEARDGVAVVPDFTGFGSVEAVDEAVERAYQRAAEKYQVNEMSLPVRQPAGLVAFAVAGAVVSSWRRFEPGELSAFPNAAGAEAVDCKVSFQQLGEEFHICLAHRWGELAPQSRDLFRNICTVLARQAMVVAIPDAGVIFHGGKHAAPEHRGLIRQVNAMAKRFHFYRHLLPSRDLKEQFCRVDMGWDGVRFVDPDFSALLYEAIPAVLRAACEGFEENQVTLKLAQNR